MHTAASLLLTAVFALAPVTVQWYRRRKWGLPARICVDPDDLRPGALARYLAEVAARLDEHPERMRLSFEAERPPGRKVRLDFTPEGRMAVWVEGRRRKKFDLRHRWIPDHPVPLDLWPSPKRRKGVVLFIEPVDGNRFRVMQDPPRSMATPAFVCSSLFATLGLVLGSMECGAVAAGLLLGRLLSSQAVSRRRRFVL